MSNPLRASEHQLQSALCTYLALQARPEILWTAVANGGKRHIGVAMKLKREGVKAGAPDLFFLLPEGRTALLEMKIKGGSLSAAQREWRDKARALGHHWAVAKTMDEAVAFLKQIGVLR